MVVAISMGCCYDLGLSIQDRIRFIQKYASLIDGIELLFALPKNLLDFEFEEDTLNFVKSLKFKSLHMPFKDIQYDNKRESNKLIEKASFLAKQVAIEHIIFHPNTIKDYNSLDNQMINCIENLNQKPENTGFCTIKEIELILDKNPSLKFVLDACHALENNIEPTDFLKFENKLVEIHLSAQWIKKGNLRAHGFLTEANQEQLTKLKPILKLDKPKIIEADFYPYKMPLIEKEIDLIKRG